jgi:hypothetical protein
MGLTRYIYTGRGEIAAEERSGYFKYYRCDTLGSVSQLVNDQNTATDRFMFDAFGNTLERTGATPTPMLWTCQRGTYTPQTSEGLARYFLKVGGISESCRSGGASPVRGPVLEVPYAPGIGQPLSLSLRAAAMRPYAADQGEGELPPAVEAGADVLLGPIAKALVEKAAKWVARRLVNPRKSNVKKCGDIGGILGACIALSCSMKYSLDLYKDLKGLPVPDPTDPPEKWEVYWMKMKKLVKRTGCGGAPDSNPIDDCCKNAYNRTGGDWKELSIGWACEHLKMKEIRWKMCYLIHGQDEGNDTECDNCCKDSRMGLDSIERELCSNHCVVKHRGGW